MENENLNYDYTTALFELRLIEKENQNTIYFEGHTPEYNLITAALVAMIEE